MSMLPKKRIDLSWIKMHLRSDYFLLLIIATGYISIVSTLAIWSHHSFNTNAWDLGIYSQALYSTLNHGKIFYYTSELPGNPSGSLFGIHFSPFLFLLIPVYALYQNPVTLLVLRPIAIAAGVIPLYWIARERIDSKWLIFLLAIIYLVYPPVMVPISNFDVEVFLPVLFLFALHYLKNGKLLHASPFIVLALMVNEFVPFIVVTMAIYFSILRRKDIIEGLKRRRLTKNAIFSIVLLLGGILWFKLACMVITSFNPTALSTKWEWGELGTEPTEIIVNAFANPMNTARVLFTDGQSKFLYVISLLAPLAFSSLLAPLTLVMTLPWLTASLLSINPMYYDIVTQYPAFVSSFIFVSAIHGLKKLMNSESIEMPRNVAFLMIVSLLISSLLLPTGGYFSVGKSDESVRTALDTIPVDASVSVMPEVYPHLCNRLEVYPYFKIGVDYVLINVYSGWYDVTLPQPAHTAQRWSHVEIDDRYGVVVNANGVLLYKSGYKGPIEHFESVNFTHTYCNVQLATGEIIEDHVGLGESVAKAAVLVHRASDPTPLFFEVPQKALPPGTYKVTVVLKASSTATDEAITLQITKNPERSNIVTQEIMGTDFTQAQRWQFFTLNFTIRQPTFIEMAAYVTNSTDVYFHCMNVLQVSGEV